MENKLNDLKPLFSRKKSLTFQKRSKKMFLHWRANLADQNKQQPLKINIRVTYQALRSLANAGFQNRGVCLQAFPSFPSPSPHFHFLALVSFLARPKPRIPFLGLSLLRNQTETLATQASPRKDSFISNTSEGGGGGGGGGGCLKKKDGLFEKRDHAAEGQKRQNFQLVNKSSRISPHKVLQ